MNAAKSWEKSLTFACGMNFSVSSLDCNLDDGLTSVLIFIIRYYSIIIPNGEDEAKQKKNT